MCEDGKIAAPEKKENEIFGTMSRLYILFITPQGGLKVLAWSDQAGYASWLAKPHASNSEVQALVGAPK